MKLTSTFIIFNSIQNDVSRINDSHYELLINNFNEYWDEECILHPTNSHCKLCD